MALFDMDKNSLPEQVQQNKEDIKDIKDNIVPDALQEAKDYADEKDDDTLDAAKDYTDNHAIDAGHILAINQPAGKVLTTNGLHGASWEDPATPTVTASDIDSESATSGKVLTADGAGAASWEDPATPTVTASDIDSESATSGKVLTADGNGGATWQDVQGGGETITHIWDGSVGVTSSIADVSGVSLKNNQMYRLLLTNSSGKGFYFYIKTCQYPSTEITQGCGFFVDNYYSECAVFLTIVQPSSIMRIRYTRGVSTNTNTAYTGTLYLKSVDEVN